MLSFMKEQSSQVPAEQENQNKENQNKDDSQEYLSVSRKKQSVKKGTIILVGMFVVGFICLFLMIKQTSPKSAKASEKAEDAQLEIALAKLTGQAAKTDEDMNHLVDKFYDAANVKQIQANELKKNPFQLEMFNADVEAAISDESDEEKNIPKQIMKQQTEKLKLFSIMQSPEGSCCMINDQLLYKGDKINGFKVLEINKKSVKLSSGDREKFLSLKNN